jgi:hypothetical protein
VLNNKYPVLCDTVDSFMEYGILKNRSYEKFGHPTVMLLVAEISDEERR